jgi:hypothetical protein
LITIVLGTPSGERSLFAQSPSPDGAELPPATQIVDTSGAVWTLASDLRVLRNGVQASTGYGTRILLSQSTIYVFGTNAQWWRWTGSSWVLYGATKPTATSPSGTQVPPSTQIVDTSGNVWTLASDFRVLRNGVQAAGGSSRQMLWLNQTLYVLGMDGVWWYQWNGSGWVPYGRTAPSTTTSSTPSPSGTQVPPATQIVDGGGAVWTLASDSRVLRNGVQAAGGYSRQMQWLNQTLYVLGLDGVSWYQWNGTGWLFYGQTAPGSTSSPTPSGSGTQIPPASQIVDSGGAVWTLASDSRVLRNGVQAAGGAGRSILWLNQTLYVLGLDGIWWYQWNGSGWTLYGQTSPAGGPAPQPSVTGDYYVSAGQSIQSVLDGATAGQTIVLRSGVHRLQTLRVKSGLTLVGEQGAILSGARLLTSFTQSGAYWTIGGQTQQGAVVGLPTVCYDTSPRCAYPEDLFIDDRVLVPVGSLAEVTSGKWFFDYANDRVYMADNPTGHKVEISVTPAAFTGYSENVTLRGLTIEKFATPTAEAAVNGGTLGWVIEDCEIRWNHFAGVRSSEYTTARRNYIHHNGAYGFIGAGNGANIDNNEISYNNTLGYNAYVGAGGAKFVNTANLVLQNNFVHHNNGPGLHTDLNNIYLLVERNRVEDNNLSGIFHEVGYQAVIRYNTVSRNGRSRPSPYWVDGAGILVSASPDVEVYGNTVTDNFQGIAALAWNRGSGTYGPYLLKNLYVHDNAIYQQAPQPGGAGRTGVIDKDGTGAFSANNRFVRNSYWLGTNLYYFMWMNVDINESTWRNYGQDTSGSFTR